ncbi:MAG: RNA methyltransferase [Flavobacteriales bacterium]|nr:RNA methyltransferase [Flavobacteriales bacterium]
MVTKKQIKLIKSLAFKKNRIKHQLFVVEGHKIVAELLDSNYEIVSLFATIDWISKNSVNNVIQVTNSDLSRISNQKSPNEVLALVKIKKNQILHLDGITLVLDNINDPGNLGTIVRACDWFGVKQIICSRDTVDIYNPKVVQSAMGSLLRINVSYTDLSDYLRNVSKPIYGAYMHGDNILDMEFPKDLCLIMGNEAHGISTEISQYIDYQSSIRNIGNSAESLNVAMATSIFLYEISN